MSDKKLVGGYCIHSKNANKSCLSSGNGAMSCKNTVCPGPESEVFEIPGHTTKDEKPAYNYKSM